jgi:cellulose synthase/poly-beta-1,6-N-acetylglucosamine synthase-like glycosyltransferase
VGTDEAGRDREEAVTGPPKPTVSDGFFVSVVVPTTGRSTLASCLEALGRQTRPPDEIVVVRDDERRGSAWARNEGIRRARGDLISFTDDDCIVPPDWIERLVRAVSPEDVSAAGGPAPKETDPLLRAKELRRQRRGVSAEWVGDTANIIYRRSWLDALQVHDGFVFDESYPTAVDTELAWRLLRRGAKLVFVPNPVTHLRRVTAAGYLRFQFRRGRGIGALFLAHRAAGSSVTANVSHLWGPPDRGQRARWGRVFLDKAIGPFDVSSFQGPGQFSLFWLGEKFEGAGFLFELAKWRLAFGRCKSRGPAGGAVPEVRRE